MDIPIPRSQWLADRGSSPHSAQVYADAVAAWELGDGFATTAQLLKVMTRQQLDVQVRNGGLVRVWYGIYAASEPNLVERLAALDIFTGHRAVACMGTG